MQDYTIDSILQSGLGLAPLVLLPIAAVVCAVALTIAILRRRPVIGSAAVLVAAAVTVIATTLRPSAITPAAIDLLVLQIPIAMALGAVPAAVWRAFRSVRSQVPTASAAADSAAGADVQNDAVVLLSAVLAAPPIDARRAPALQNAA